MDLISQSSILTKHLKRGIVERKQSCLTGLRLSDADDALSETHILSAEGGDLTDSHACYRQKAEYRIVGMPTQTIAASE